MKPATGVIAAIQIPAETWGPAGSVINFMGRRIIRATDENTLGGASFDMGDDGGACRWAKDSSRLWVSTTGGKQLVFDFDAKLEKLTAPQAYGGNGRLAFSKKDASRSFFYVNGIVGGMSPLVVDMKQALPAGFTVSWASSFAVSQDETTCTMAFGPGHQGSANLIISYRVGKGFRVLDTLTGIVTGDWGKLGKITTPLGWHLHETSQLMDSRYATFGATAADIPNGQPVPRFVWDIPTLEVYPRMPGHQAEGKSTFALLGTEWQLKTQKFGAAAIVGKPLLPSGTPSHDAHYSWNNCKNDKQKFLVSGCPVGGKITGPLTAPGEAMIMLVDPKTGNVTQVCPTFSSGNSPFFACANAIPNISQNGAYVAWPSDGMGEFNGRSEILIAGL